MRHDEEGRGRHLALSRRQRHEERRRRGRMVDRCRGGSNRRGGHGRRRRRKSSSAAREKKTREKESHDDCSEDRSEEDPPGRVGRLRAHVPGFGAAGLQLLQTGEKPLLSTQVASLDRQKRPLNQVHKSRRSSGWGGRSRGRRRCSSSLLKRRGPRPRRGLLLLLLRSFGGGCRHQRRTVQFLIIQKREHFLYAGLSSRSFLDMQQQCTLTDYGRVLSSGGGVAVLEELDKAARANARLFKISCREEESSRKFSHVPDPQAPTVQLSEDDSVRLAWLAASFSLDTRLGICCMRVKENAPRESSAAAEGQHQLLVSFSLLEKAVRSLAPELLPVCKRLFKEAGRCKTGGRGGGEEYTMTQQDVHNLRRCLASTLLREAQWQESGLPTRPRPTFRLESLSSAQVEKIMKKWRESLESLRDHGGKLRRAYAFSAHTFTSASGFHLRKLLEVVLGGDCGYDATRPRHIGLGFSPTYQVLRSEREVEEDHARLSAWQWPVEVFEVKSRHHFVPRPPLLLSDLHGGKQHPTDVPGGEPEEEPPQEAG